MVIIKRIVVASDFGGGGGSDKHPVNEIVFGDSVLLALTIPHNHLPHLLPQVPLPLRPRFNHSLRNHPPHHQLVGLLQNL